MKKNLLLCIILLSFSELYSQDTLVFKVPYIQYPDTTLVFKPSHYNTNRNYPLLILLNGYSANYDQWNFLTRLQRYANIDSFVIVCPDGLYNSWYFDSPVNSKSQFEKFFYKDLIPKILSNYKIDTTNIFISGLSMGGSGAMYLFLKNPKFFKSAGSTSGVLDITPFPANWEVKNYLGDYHKNKSIWEQHSAINLLNNIRGTNRPIIVDCGLDDFSLQVNKNFVNRCKEMGVDVTFISGPGNHNAYYWAKSILLHFDFFHKLVWQKVER